MEDFTTKEYERLDAKLAECQRDLDESLAISNDAVALADKAIDELEKAERQRDALAEACKAMLPVIQYILTNGWDESPPIDIEFDEHEANQLAVNALAMQKDTT